MHDPPPLCDLYFEQVGDGGDGNERATGYERVVREASAPLLLLREPASMGARASYDGVLDAMRWNVPAERGA